VPLSPTVRSRDWNHVAGVNGGNEIIARLSATGSICVFTSNATHLTVDITGYVA
jgi:hypothetical protein